MAARFDVMCPVCGHELHDVRAPFGASPVVACPQCDPKTLMVQTFRHRTEVVINYGYREHKYANPTDRDIERFRFENL